MELQKPSVFNLEPPPPYNPVNSPPPIGIVIPVQAPSCYNASYCSTQPQLDPKAGRIIWIILCIFLAIFIIGFMYTTF